MPLTCVEFYCGIGGMHYGLKVADPNAVVIAAIDINTSALDIYTHNFPTTNVCRRNIQAIDARQLDAWDADVWTMSPPCQPFTKKGLQRGKEDERCESLMHLVEQLQVMAKPPRRILLENVVGFESSSMHDGLVECLVGRGYCIEVFSRTFEEFVLCPTQFGIPNRRPRFYLLARLGSTSSTSNLVKTNFPGISEENFPLQQISSFVDTTNDIDVDLRVAEKFRDKYAKSLNVVTSKSTTSACFTKSYSQYVTGCGSYYDMSCKCANQDTCKLKEEIADENVWHDKVRLLCWREVANLMCFPTEFKKPPSSTSKQMYRTLGNAVNVRVVSELLKALFRDFVYL